MNRPFRALAGIAAGAVLLTSAAVVAAQDHAPPPSGAMGEKWHEHMQEHMQAHIKALHDILQIRPDQETAFQTFVASMKPPEGAEHGDMEREHHEMANMTTPQRLDMMAQHMAEHQKAFERHAAAIKTFYAVLNPQQQKAFDVAMAHHFHHHGMGGMEGHGHMGPHGGMDGEGEM